MNILKFGIFSHKPRWWLHNVKQFFKNIKYAWQRIIRGFSDPDWWELDSYISRVIAGGLGELNKMRNGFPPELDLQFGENNGDKEWSRILSEIVSNIRKYEDIQFNCSRALNGLSKEEIPNWYKEKQKEAESAWNNAFELIKKWHQYFWD